MTQIRFARSHMRCLDAMIGVSPAALDEVAERGLGRDAPRPCADAIINRPRPPISAGSTTSASATTAPATEIVQNLLLARPARLQLTSDLLRQPQEHLATHRDRQLRRVPRQIETRRSAVARHQDP